MAKRLADFELPPQWSTMREAARLEKVRNGRIVHMEKGDYVSPEFKPPIEAIQAINRSLENGFVRYSPGPGLWSLRCALATEMSMRGRPTIPEEIIVTPGAKFAIAACLLLLLDDESEVIMPNPGYPPDEFWARYLRATVRHVRFRDPRHLDTDHLNDLINSRTRLLILNTPQRPNGQLIENIDEIAGVLMRHPDVTIVSDEIFSKIVYSPYAHYSLANYPELRERTLIIDTFSKTFVMTGFRIGWVTAPVNLANKIDVLLQNSCTNVCTIIQEAALAALSAPRNFSDNLISTLRHKRDLAFEVLASSRTLDLTNAQGTFYLFLKLPKQTDDREMARRLLQHNIAVVAGSAFGSAGAHHLRITFTLEDNVLLDGVRRLVDSIDEMVE